MEIKLSNKTSPEKLEFFQAASQYLRYEHKIFYKDQASRIGMDEKRMQNMMAGNSVRPTDEEIDALFKAFWVKLKKFKHPFLIDAQVVGEEIADDEKMRILKAQEAEIARLKTRIEEMTKFYREGGKLFD